MTGAGWGSRTRQGAIWPALLLALVFAAPVSAFRGHNPLACLNGGGQATRVIEQQTTDYSNPVVNPGIGVWSGYDDRTLVCGGWMDVGASDSISQPLVEDNLRHPITVHASSTSPDLTVVVMVDEDTFVLVPSSVKGGYVYDWTGYTGSYADLSTLPLIEGSNGGRGDRISVSLSISNPTAKAIRGAVSASLYIGRSYGF